MKRSSTIRDRIGGWLILIVLELNLFALYQVSLVVPRPPFGLPLFVSEASLNVPQDEYQDLDERINATYRRTFTAPLIPPSVWPPVLGDFETIVHPALPNVKMSVPKFWSRPIHQNGLISRRLTNKIGSCLSPECLPEERTIYFAIASYRDYQCRQTIESAFQRAAHPERIRIGVVDQIKVGTDIRCNEPIQPCAQNASQALCLYANQIDVYTMDDDLSVGPVLARHIGQRLYRGEYYALQCDAHVTFTRHWDTEAIAQLSSTKNEMAVITNYMSDVQNGMTDSGVLKKMGRAVMCNTDFEFGTQGTILRHGQQSDNPARGEFKGVPLLQPYWAAGLSFARGHFVVNVEYDQYLPNIFQGEEMSIGIRAWTMGYDLYAPARSWVFHHYAIGRNKLARNIPHFWEHQTNYSGIGKTSMVRLLNILEMNTKPYLTWNQAELEYYGIGKVRTPDKFFQTFGIYPFNQTTEHHLCKFVESGDMHKKFTRYLRKDGMGIDYDYIDYRFKDPTPGAAFQNLKNGL